MRKRRKSDGRCSNTLPMDNVSVHENGGGVKYGEGGFMMMTLASLGEWWGVGDMLGRTLSVLV